MKKTILLIFAILIATQLYATDWYVNKNASGNNSGTSWANAWTSITTLNSHWASILPGDRIFISGGTDSLIYTNETIRPTANGTSTAYIYILPGKYAPNPTGHSGRVILDGNSDGEHSVYFQSSSSSSYRRYIYVKGLECRNTLRPVECEDYTRCITIDSMTIYEFHDQAGIRLDGAATYTIDSTIIKNNVIISPLLYSAQTDGIFGQRCQRTLVHNNYVRARNQDPVNHNDNLQGYLSQGWVIYNNYFINDSVYSPEGGGTPIMLGVDGTMNNLVYNNYLYMGGIWDPSGSQNACWWSREYNNQDPNTWLLYNTIVTNGPRCRDAQYEYNTWTYGNIFAMFSTSSQMASIEETFDHGLNHVLVDSIKYNLFYRNTGSPSFAGDFRGNGTTLSSPSWTQFSTTLGGSSNLSGNPLFVKNIGNESNQGLLKPDIKVGSPAINAGWDQATFQAKIDYLNNLGFSGSPHTGEWRLPYTDINNKAIVGGVRDLGSFEFGSADWTPPDTVPSFSFTSLNNMEINTSYIASSVFSGSDSTFHVLTNTGARFNINNSSNLSTTMKSANNGDVVYVEVLTGMSYSTGYSETIIAGGVSRSFTVTTKADPGSGEPATDKPFAGSNGLLILDKNGIIIKVK